jgi:hypothetical protein
VLEKRAELSKLTLRLWQFLDKCMTGVDHFDAAKGNIVATADIAMRQGNKFIAQIYS